MMKKVLLISVLLLCWNCVNNKKQNTSDNKENSLPVKVDIYYEPGTPPWLLLKIMDISPKDFLRISDVTYFTLTDSTSLKYFHDLIERHNCSSPTNCICIDTWFSAVVDYGVRMDTVSVNSHFLMYNNLVFEDTSAVYFYMDKICESDSLTYERFKEFYFDNDFQLISKEQLNNIPKRQ